LEKYKGTPALESTRSAHLGIHPNTSLETAYSGRQSHRLPNAEEQRNNWNAAYINEVINTQLEYGGTRYARPWFNDSPFGEISVVFCFG
jgi:hypothetical protein